MKILSHVIYPPLTAEWQVWKAWHPVWLYREFRWLWAWPWRKKEVEYWQDEMTDEMFAGAMDTGVSPMVYYRSYPHHEWRFSSQGK